MSKEVMEFRVRAAAIILNDQSELLLVLHRHPRTGEEWWTLPGGGLKAEEDAKSAVIREVREECGIKCTPMKLVYVREFIDEENILHHFEMFFTARATNLNIITGCDPELSRQYIIKTDFLSQQQVESLDVNVFPEILKDRFWADLASGFKGHDIYLGQYRFLKRN